MNIKETTDKFIMQTYSRFPLVLKKGNGVYLYDENGKKYLDFTAGIAVNALGYGNKNIIDAANTQMQKLFHVSNLYYTEPMALLAKKLVEKSCFDKVFFANSGAEANEAAFKLARKYGQLKKNGASKIISMQNSFHGRTMATVTLTGQSKYHNGFGPMMSDILYAEFNNIDSVKKLIDENVCAVFIEPVQGEGGLLPANKGFMKELKDICTKNKILLIFDEVQTGIGRCGKLFCYQNFDIEPDILTLAKGLGGGLPIGAALAKEKAAQCFAPGNHASTFGGNPVACACANAVLNEIESKDILQNVNKSGEYLIKKLKEINCPHIKDIRGMGLMAGLELDIEIAPIIKKCLENGLLIIGAGKNVIRFVPPLIINKDEIDEGIEILKTSLQCD